MMKPSLLLLLAVTSDAITAPRSKLSAPKTHVVQRGGGAMTESAATISLFKTIVGGGILALPAGMAAAQGTGILPGLAILALHAGVSAYTYALVGRSVAATRARTFAELWGKAFGTGTAWIIDLIIVGVAGGAALTYNCFTGDLLKQLTGVDRTKAILLLTLFPIGPLALLRDLSALKHSTIAGLVAVFVSAVVIVSRSLDGSYGVEGDFGAWLAAAPGALDQVSTTKLSLGSAVLFNMLSTAFMCHTNAVRAYEELGPKHRHAAVARKAFRLAGLLYGVVMVAGYLTFGGACEGLVLANYDGGDPRARIAWIATLVSLLSSYPLLFTGLRDASCSLLGVTLPEKFMPFAGLSLGLLAVPTLLAIVVPDVGFVVSLMGASLGAALILVVPAMIGTRVLPDRDCSKSERAAMRLVAAFGVLVGLFGTTVTVLETYTDLLA